MSEPRPPSNRVPSRSGRQAGGWLAGLGAVLLLTGAVWTGAWAWAWGLGSLALGAALGRARVREQRLRDQLAHRTEAIEALDLPLLILDRDDRLQWCSQAFLRLYPSAQGHVDLGTPYSDLAARVLGSGDLQLSAQERDSWLQRRAQTHQQHRLDWMLSTRDGRRLQMVERPTALGGWASLRFDVTELVAVQSELKRTNQQLREAREMLDEAVEALPAGFEIWGADDRLILCNQHVRDQYPVAGELLKPGVPFESVVRSLLEAGAIPSARGRERTWLLERLSQRGRSVRPFLLDYQGHWMSIAERRMPSGRLVSVRQDVTELVQARNAITQARELAEQRLHLLNQAINALPIALEIWEPSGKLLLVNQQYRQWYPDVDYDALIGKTFEDAIRVAQRQGMLPVEARANEEAWIAERVLTHGQRPEMLAHLPDGRWILTRESRTPDGFTFTVRQDLTQLMQQEQALQSSQAQIDAIIRTAGAAILTVGANGRVRFANPAAESLWGHGPGSLVGRRVLKLLQRHERQPLRELFRRHLAGQNVGLIGPRRELQARCPHGSERAIHAAISEVHSGTDHFFVSVVTDISAAKRLERDLLAANERLARLSSQDDLTQLANRRSLEEGLRQVWAHALRLQHPISILMVDVDHFKPYNDAHGHAAGDGALRQIARVLQAAARRGTDVVARYGGEEFVLVLDHCAPEAALERAASIRAELAELNLPHAAAPEGRITLSIGLCGGIPGRGMRASEWLARADAALYEAKKRGRDRVEVRQPAASPATPA
ncbi:diguanylate cyclase [Inhella gelatinilytica]|uniref:Diguanylate cyclase n=1 Tax=Inhella gelatinilytica TaxID=2795030 RepID=A0A931NCR3_9BURK|nr:diguanylate cyclase [Inhella gelatinilytica]MBH9551809.1 diguanylate cyclase [Inhella gelatinilytica]